MIVHGRRPVGLVRFPGEHHTGAQVLHALQALRRAAHQTGRPPSSFSSISIVSFRLKSKSVQQSVSFGKSKNLMAISMDFPAHS